MNHSYLQMTLPFSVSVKITKKKETNETYSKCKNVLTANKKT